MEKVKLPKEVEEAIEYFQNRSLDYPDQGIMAMVHRPELHLGDPDKCRIIKDFATSIEGYRLLLQALVNGYEVEQTPEDKVREYFDNVKANLIHPNGYYGNEVRGETIINVLDLLGIKISGVNN